MRKKIVAIVGGYRKEGTVDSAVEAILAGARERGAATHVIYLTECHIEPGNGTQEPGPKQGKGLEPDDMEPLLEEIEAADAVVLGSPVNCGTTTPVFRRFEERLLGFGYRPCGRMTPRGRLKALPRKAVLVASSPMPGFLIPLFTGTMTALKTAAGMLHARPVGRMYIGLASGEPHRALSARTLRRARRLGLRLAA